MKIKKKCDVCQNEIIIDQWGNGKCKFCKWEQSQDCSDFPDVINPPNFISLNTAKKYYIENKKFYPTYDEAMELIERGLDFSFVYNNKRYLLEKNDVYSLYDNNYQNIAEYESFEALTKNLSINEVKLKEIWSSLKNFKYEC